jgi:hypothetical protein
MSPSWWGVLSASASAALALFFLLQWARRPRCRALCAAHGVMALAMAVMSSPWAFLVPPAMGASVFAVAVLWSGWCALARWGRGADEEAQFCVGSAVMAFMYVSQLLGGHHHGTGVAGTVEVLPVAVALVFAGGLAFQVGRTLSTLGIRPCGPCAHRAAVRPAPELAAGAAMSCLMIPMLLIGVA